jgi:sugar/nucleoside kinase (ribokinase family)
MRSGILAGGNWIVDHVKLIDGWPPQDSLATILSESAANGGAPYNVLKDLAKLEAPFPLAAVGLVGEDANGRSILADCRAHRIDPARLQFTREAPTSYTDVMTIQATGRRTFFHLRGANALLGPEHFDFTATSAKLFHLGYLLLLDRLDAPGPDGRPGAATVLSRARAAGLRTSLDCVSENSDRFGRIAAPVLPEVDYFFANEFEAERLTGLSLRPGDRLDRAAVEAAAARLIGSGVWQASLRVPAAAIRGAVGAGDALAAGILYGLHEDWSVERCLRLGVSAAASCLSHPSASAGVSPASACLALADRWGFQGAA